MIQQAPSDMKGSLRAIWIMFYALVIGVVIFLIIITGLLQFIKPSLEEKNVHNIFLITASLLALICFVFGTAAYKNKIGKIVNSDLNVTDKFNKYREALIAYYAACEGAALFAAICLFLTENYWFIVIAIAMLAAMWYRMPSKHRLISDLQLTSQEQQEF